MCGIIGIVGDKNASEIIQMGLYALQHRGQESWGMICRGKRQFYPEFFPHKVQGLVRKEQHLSPTVSFIGSTGIGHIRYSTQGSNLLNNAQPHFSHATNDPEGERLYLAANGDITNLNHLREILTTNQIEVDTDNDGEVLVKIIGLYYFKHQFSMVKAIQEAQKIVFGSFAAVLLTPKYFYAFRDLYGFRPLVMGKKSDQARLFASETVALDQCGFSYDREVKRGEIIEINLIDSKLISYQTDSNPRPCSRCIFELIYFSHPSSKTFGIWIDPFRKQLGKSAAELFLSKHPEISADEKNNWIVSAVPDSSNAAALALARKLNLDFDFCLVRSHYTGRSFISPTQENRDFDVTMKFSVNWQAVKNKHVIIVDDSLVRGTTMKKIVTLIKKAGALSVHLVIVSPPIKFSCHMGIDTHRRSELIAARLTEKQIAELLEVDSLLYNKVTNMAQVIKECGGDWNDFCLACFTGDYPCPISD